MSLPHDCECRICHRPMDWGTSWSASGVGNLTVAPDTGAAASGVMGPVVTPEPLCRNCGQAINDHRLANFADGPHIGANFLVCQTATYQPAHPLGAVPTGVATTPQGETSTLEDRVQEARRQIAGLR